jgi:hypothetical protein
MHQLLSSPDRASSCHSLTFDCDNSMPGDEPRRRVLCTARDAGSARPTPPVVLATCIRPMTKFHVAGGYTVVGRGSSRIQWSNHVQSSRPSLVAPIVSNKNWAQFLGALQPVLGWSTEVDPCAGGERVSVEEAVSIDASARYKPCSHVESQQVRL